MLDLQAGESFPFHVIANVPRGDLSNTLGNLLRCEILEDGNHLVGVFGNFTKRSQLEWHAGGGLGLTVLHANRRKFLFDNLPCRYVENHLLVIAILISDAQRLGRVLVVIVVIAVVVIVIVVVVEKVVRLKLSQNRHRCHRVGQSNGQRSVSLVFDSNRYFLGIRRDNSNFDHVIVHGSEHLNDFRVTVRLRTSFRLDF